MLVIMFTPLVNEREPQIKTDQVTGLSKQRKRESIKCRKNVTELLVLSIRSRFVLGEDSPRERSVGLR